MTLISILLMAIVPGAPCPQVDATMTDGDLFGHSVAGGADFDGDSIPDYVISAPIEHRGVGVVRVYSGEDGRVLREIVGPDGAHSFGDAVRVIQDIDCDGIQDLIITAAEHVHALSGADGEALWKARAGHPLRGCEVVRDTNGDDREEIIVSVVPWDGQDGVARMLSGEDGSTLFEVPAAGGHGCVASLKDVSGDGRGDFAVVGSNGRIGVHSGSDGGFLYSTPSWGGFDPLWVSLRH
jgi:hypothetical protein